MYNLGKTTTSQIRPNTVRLPNRTGACDYEIKYDLVEKRSPKMMGI